MANRITAVIDVVADRAKREVQSFRQSVQEADGALGKMKAGAQSIGDTLRANSGPAMLAAGAAAIQFGKQSVEAASNLEESLNAVNVAFGDSADGIHELGETSVESFGLSQRAFNEAAVAMSSFAETVAGEGGDVTATMGDLIGRATDFASVYNLDVSEALQVFQSTLAGQTEPIRKYGKDISAAAVEQYALAEGLVESKSEMTEAIKVQARYGLLMQQTADTTGDFANTQDSLANQTRILQANMENLQAQIGEHLIPAISEAVEGLNNLMETGEEWDAIDRVKGLNDALKGVTTGNFDGFFQNIKQAITGVDESAEDAADSVDEVAKRSAVYGDFLAELNRRVQEAEYWDRKGAAAREDLAEAAEEAAQSAEEQAEAERELAERLQAQEQRVRDLIDARNELAGAAIDAERAEMDYLDAVDNLNETLNDSEATERDRRRAVLNTLDATERMIEAQIEADGVAVDSAFGQQLLTEKLLEQARVIGGPVAGEILLHIARLNGIPAEKVTEIQAEVNRGDVDAARRILESELGKAKATPLIEIAQGNIDAEWLKFLRTFQQGVTIPVRTGGSGGSSGGPRRSHVGSWFGPGDGAVITGNQAAYMTAGSAGRLPSDEQARRAISGGGQSGPPVTVVIQATDRTTDEIRAIVDSAIAQRLIQ